MTVDPEQREFNVQSEPSALILFVDDNPALRTIIPEVLTRSGHRVITADGGESCLQILTETKPDMIILDIMMEPMDGWDTLKAIRAVPEYRDIPIVVLTGKVFLPSEMCKYGPDIAGWIKKPVRMEPFTKEIQKTLIELAEDQTIADALSDPITDEERREITIHRRRLRVLHRIYDGVVTQCLQPNGEPSTGWCEETNSMTDLIAEEERWCMSHGLI